jgi:hypothetical protein
MVLRQNAR